MNFWGAKLVFMNVNCWDLREGKRVFDKVANENIFLWNLMINEYAKFGDFGESIRLFRMMQELGIEANSFTFPCVLKCLAALGNIKGGNQTHDVADPLRLLRQD
jgi:pentatricopeptide repeat protein